MGAEKIVHGLRACVEKHWLEENFVVLKVDMKNAGVASGTPLRVCQTFS